VGEKTREAVNRPISPSVSPSGLNCAATWKKPLRNCPMGISTITCLLRQKREEGDEYKYKVLETWCRKMRKKQEKNKSTIVII
jgi:hypothetical protein